MKRPKPKASRLARIQQDLEHRAEQVAVQASSAGAHIDPRLLEAMRSGSTDERLTAMAALVTAMYEAIIVAPPGQKPEGLAAMSRRESCHRARVGRAARRAGMSLEEFVEEYGAVDRVPEEPEDETG